MIDKSDRISKNSLFAKSLILIISCLALWACHKQSKEDLFNLGLQEMKAGNPKGAIVYYLNALELDPNYIDARKNLAACYLSIGKLDKSEAELTTLVSKAPNDDLVTLTLAQIYNHSDRAGKAIALAEKILARDPGNAKALEVLGDSSLQQKDYTKAKGYYLKALQQNPSQLSAKLGLANSYRLLGETDAARQTLNEVINTDPSQKNAYYALVNIESNAGNGSKALEILNRYLKTAPDDLQTLYWVGVLLLNNNSLNEAETIAGKLLEKQPTNPGGHQIKGLILYARGDFPAAIVELNQQLKFYNDIIGHHFLGLAYVQTNQLELAINHFQKVLDINPAHLQSRLQIASALTRQKRFDEALAEIAKVRQADPDNAFAYYLMGNAYMGKGNYDRAIEALDQAIALNPKLIDAQVKKGLFSLAEGKPDNAEAELAKAISAAPQVTNNRLLLVNLQLRQQKFDEALQTLRKGLTNRPDDAILYNYMAAAYFGMKKADQAIDAFQKAKKASPEFLAPYLNLAQFYFASGNQAKALEEYQALLQKAPGNIRGLIGVAVIQEINGDDAAALASYQKLAETDPLGGALALSGYWLRHNDKNKAMEVIEKAYAANKEDPRILEQRGRLAMSLKNSDIASESLMALEKRQEGRGLPLLIEYQLASGQPEKAKALADEAIARQPNSAYGYGLLAFVHNAQKRPEQVENTLLTGIAKVSGNPLPLKISLADFYLASGKPTRAKTLLDGMLKQYPRSPEVLYTTANYYESIGEKNQAIPFYKSVLAENPNHIAAQNNLAYIYATGGTNLDEALDLAVRAFRAAPNNPSLMDTLGFILLKKGQADKAAKLLEKASTVLPQSMDVKLHLAQAYLARGEGAKARAILQPIAESGPPAPAAEARTLLQAGAR